MLVNVSLLHSNVIYTIIKPYNSGCSYYFVRPLYVKHLVQTSVHFTAILVYFFAVQCNVIITLLFYCYIIFCVDHL